MKASTEDIDKRLQDVLTEIFERAQQYNPQITEVKMLEHIIECWLQQYKQAAFEVYRKDAVELENNLQLAISESGKTQGAIANEIGVDRAYLNQVINGKSEPSIKIALLIGRSVGYPPERINDLFYLAPTD